MSYPAREGFVFAVLALGLGPREAWALTPRELAMLAGALAPARAPGRGELERLMAAFPDGRDGDGRHGN